MITVVSLGAERGDLTLWGREALLKADEVLVRTDTVPPVQTLDDEGIPYATLDFLYDSSRNYDTLVKKIAAEVKRRARDGKNVCYCVDGDGAEDAAAALLLKGGAALIGGRPKSGYLAAKAGLDGGYTAASAFSFRGPFVRPLVLYDVTGDNVGDLKLLLSERFGDEAPAVFVNGSAAKAIPLFEADRQAEYGALCGLVLPEEPLLGKKRFGFSDFVAIMERLRAPDGCPWDRVQTHESIRINAIEEAYELVDAIDLKDPDKICEEAGDLLMQSVFHTLIEAEAGNFTVTDMLTELCEKLITRHTHVFGTDKASGAEGALSVWEKNKMTEKHQVTYSDVVNDVPQCFPALLRAQKIAKRVEKGGWDAATIENFEAKFREEYAELIEAVKGGDKARVAEELGDVLFCVVELGRAVGADCEMALLDTVKKMQKRYTCYESLVRADGKDPTALSQAERDSYYQRAKNDTRA